MADAVSPQPVAPRAPAGDVKALEREALTHAPALYKLAARLTGSTADADDVLQDAFARAITELRRGGFRGDCALLTWLYRIVTNAALDRLRRGKRHDAAAERLAAEPAGTSASPEASVALRELGEAMAALPEDQRAALVLKEIQGLTTREVAEVLERSEGACEQLLVRARQALKARFEP